MSVLALWENTNQITHLIESMDKLTKEGKHRTATETLKACSGTFYCGLKIILHFLQYWKCLQKKSLTPENQNVLCSYCGIVYEAAEILCLAPANGCREGSSRCGNKKLAVTDDINQREHCCWISSDNENRHLYSATKECHLPRLQRSCH